MYLIRSTDIISDLYLFSLIYFMQDILKLLPPEEEVMRQIKQRCADAQTKERSSLEDLFVTNSPSLTLYQLEVS